MTVGPSVAVGYAPAMVLGAFLITAPAAAHVVATPAGIPSVFAALVYPVLFGAVCGVLAKKHVQVTEADGDVEETTTETA